MQCVKHTVRRRVAQERVNERQEESSDKGRGLMAKHLQRNGGTLLADRVKRAAKAHGRCAWSSCVQEDRVYLLWQRTENPCKRNWQLGAEASSDNTTSTTAIVVLVHVELGQLHRAAYWDGSAVQVTLEHTAR